MTAVRIAKMDESDRHKNGSLPRNPGAACVPIASAEASPIELPSWPLEVLPELTRRCVQAFAAATSSPVELAAQPALAVASAALGPAWRVVAEEYERSPALWLAVVAASGQAKTPTARPVREPLVEVDIQLREEWQADHAEWEAAERAAKARARKSAHAPPADPGPEPKRRKLAVTDISAESLAQDLNVAEGHGLLLHSDELASMLEGMDAYSKNGSQKGRKFYLSVWSGEEVRVSRVSKSVEVDNPYLAVFGGVQPAVLSKLELKDGDGLEARFLWSVPTPRPHGLGRKIPAEERRLWRELFRAMLTAGDEEAPAAQPFTPEARALLDAHLRDSTKRANELEAVGLGLLAAMHGKASDHLVRLTALLHGLDAAEIAIDEGGVLRRRAVPVETVERAAQLVDYYLAHGKHVIGLMLQAPGERDEGRKMRESDELAATLEALVPKGTAERCDTAEWVRRCEKAGLRIDAQGERGPPAWMGKAMRRLEVKPSGSVRVRQLTRGGGKDGKNRPWEVSHVG